MTLELEALHQNAKRIAKELSSKEGELLEILTQVERARLWEILGYDSLFYYCVNELKLSPSQAYVFGGVAKKVLKSLR